MLSYGTISTAQIRTGERGKVHYHTVVPSSYRKEGTFLKVPVFNWFGSRRAANKAFGRDNDPTMKIVRCEKNTCFRIRS